MNTLNYFVMDESQVHSGHWVFSEKNVLDADDVKSMLGGNVGGDGALTLMADKMLGEFVSSGEFYDREKFVLHDALKVSGPLGEATINGGFMLREDGEGGACFLITRLTFTAARTAQ